MCGIAMILLISSRYRILQFRRDLRLVACSLQFAQPAKLPACRAFCTPASSAALAVLLGSRKDQHPWSENESNNSKSLGVRAVLTRTAYTANRIDPKRNSLPSSQG